MAELSAFTEQAKCSDEWDSNTDMQDCEVSCIFTLHNCMITLLLSTSAQTSALVFVDCLNDFLSGSEHGPSLFRKFQNFWNNLIIFFMKAAVQLTELPEILVKWTGALESSVQLVQSFILHLLRGIFEIFNALNNMAQVMTKSHFSDNLFRSVIFCAAKCRESVSGKLLFRTCTISHAFGCRICQSADYIPGIFSSWIRSGLTRRR